jgi:alpha-L-fucosidase
MIYFDWWIHHEKIKPYIKRFAAYYYNRAHEWGKEVVITYKHDGFMLGTALVNIERGKFTDIQHFFWQGDTSVAKNSWCYTDGNDYKSAESLICDLIDVVSKNGAFLLNVGPRADGSMPEQDAEILMTIGRWLKINGEAIYDTHPWRQSSEGPTAPKAGQFTDGEDNKFTSQDFRFTRKGSHLYVFALKCSDDSKICIESLAMRDASLLAYFNSIILDVQLLGYEEHPITWTRDENGFHISFEGIHSDFPLVFKIKID